MSGFSLGLQFLKCTAGKLCYLKIIGSFKNIWKASSCPFLAGIKVVIKVCPRLCLIPPTPSDQSVGESRSGKGEESNSANPQNEKESCVTQTCDNDLAILLLWTITGMGDRPAPVQSFWRDKLTKKANEQQMGDCETEQFDLFITIILNASFYLGVTILIVMVTVGLYFCIFHCFWKPYSKRWYYLLDLCFFKIKENYFLAARKSSLGSEVDQPLLRR